MYLHGIDGVFEKKYLLDMLAYLLWNENTPHELSGRHIPLAKGLYKEILEGMKKEVHLCCVNTEDFGFMDAECQELGTVYFLEKRLEVIEWCLEERLKERLSDKI